MKFNVFPTFGFIHLLDYILVNRMNKKELSYDGKDFIGYEGEKRYYGMAKRGEMGEMR